MWGRRPISHSGWGWEAASRDEPSVFVSLTDKALRGEDVTQEITEEMDNDLTTEDKSATEKVKSFRRPPLNYFEMGMKKNDILTYAKDPSVEITVFDEKKVMYQGEVYSLTGVTKKILNINHAIQPTGYWVYEGRNLRDIYDETYTLDD